MNHYPLDVYLNLVDSGYYLLEAVSRPYPARVFGPFHREKGRGRDAWHEATCRLFEKGLNAMEVSSVTVTFDGSNTRGPWHHVGRVSEAHYT